MLISVRLSRFAWIQICLVNAMLITLLSLGIYLNGIVNKGRYVPLTPPIAEPVISKNGLHDRSIQQRNFFTLSRMSDDSSL
jgi:hypothetical protein